VARSLRRGLEELRPGRHQCLVQRRRRVSVPPGGRAGRGTCPDPAGTYDAHYEPLAIDGEAHVASGWSRYFTAGGEVRDEYRNIYLIHFDGAGQATSFTEWWIQDRAFARRAREDAVAKARSEAGVGS
jgi:hypothetical protein